MRRFGRWIFSDDSPRKVWLTRHGIDWFGLLIAVVFFAGLLIMRILGA